MNSHTVSLASATFFVVAFLTGLSSGKPAEHYEGIMERLKTELAAATLPAADEARAAKLLASDKLDPKLVQYVVLKEATPAYLAEYTGQGKKQEQLIEQLFNDPSLMKQMLVADGPVSVKRGPAPYGRAMEIYTAIRSMSPKAGDGVLQRLALAISLEHATPVNLANPTEGPHAGGPTHADPLERYREFEKAYLDGELDRHFSTLSTWELRFVVDGNEPDWARAWGRQMMRSYRPDYVLEGNYPEFARSVVRYGGGDVKYDRPQLQVYQNIVMNGGICGRRAFVGRFILRSFGIPTTARPSRGHGALLYWGPDSWHNKLALGAGWTNTRYGSERNFLEMTRARRNKDAYLRVARARWIGDVLGENRVYEETKNKKAEFWNAMALRAQKEIADAVKAGTLSASTEDPGPPIGLTRNEKAALMKVSDDEGRIVRNADGSILIPAIAAQKKPDYHKHWVEMKCFDGGMQVWLSNFGPQGSRILRGGSYKSDADFCWSGRRMINGRFGRYPNWGFRVAATPGEENPPAELEVDLGDGITLELVYIKPGRFIMGGERTHEQMKSFEVSEVPRHEVTITQGFYLGKHEVTQEQYRQIMGRTESGGGPKHPTANMNTKDGDVFCELLSEKTGLDARPPTEAEWEYAARAGTTTKWFFGDDPSKLGEYAWFKDNAGKTTMPVGQKKPNPWGLYDMYGNVWERVADTYHDDYYANSPKEDPTGPSTGTASHFEYKVNVTKAGRYALTAEVVTMNYKQSLTLKVNGDATEHTLELPFTLGGWQDSPAIIVELKAGDNTLEFFRQNPPQYGISIKEFRLKPIQ